MIDTPARQHLVMASAVGRETNTREALRALALDLGIDRAGQPDFLTLYNGSARPLDALIPDVIKAFGISTLHEGSTCMGIMNERGVECDRGDAIGALAIWDADGAYGTAMTPMDEDPEVAAVLATRKALVAAGQSGEVPDLVWLTATPGHEEAVLEGIKQIVTRSTLIVGGSAADNTVGGKWSVLYSNGAARARIVVSVLFPFSPADCSFESGYVPTDRSGIVTVSAGLRVFCIDGRSAADVYSEWTGDRIQRPTEGSHSILFETTLTPLGRKQAEISCIPVHLLAHPARAHCDGSLELFAHVDPGEELWLMEGSETSLVQRAGRIARGSRVQRGNTPVAGALLVFCGACMLAIRDRMKDVAEHLAESLGGAPFLVVFSFGEQGEMPEGSCLHGKFMISSLAFGGGKPLQQGQAK
jgi:hypothetical protein